MKSKIALSAVALFGLVWLAGCGSAEPTLLPPDPKQSEELIIESVELLQLESWPVQFHMELTGTLPSACHSLDYSVILPKEDGVIEVEARAILDEDVECSQHAQSFRQGIGLGSYTEGAFRVLLNGEPVGEIQLGGGSEAPGSKDADGGMTRGPVYIDETELVILESFPVQIEIVIRGALPTPCASLEWSVEAPDDQGRIMLEAYSLQDPALACVQVLEAIEERLPIGSYSEGSYSVWLNGELVGEFEV
jgi:inhibitor of cysteine peptidase